jgi:GT2 family glycosyltransferase
MSSPVDVSHREESKAQKTGTYSVASVTVAYNGSSILPRQIDALKKQTRKLDEIVVVDNASSDDTLKLLAAQYPEVTVISLPQNIGVGGGYSSGLSRTVEKHDWIWLLDGDSAPQPCWTVWNISAVTPSVFRSWLPSASMPRPVTSIQR